MTKLALELRAMAEGDRHYVLSSWIKSYASKSREARDYPAEVVPVWDYSDPERPVPKIDGRTGQPMTRLQYGAAFSEDYAPVVRSLLARSRVLVACLEETPDIIAGWMCWEGDTLHYLLTKPSFRRLGVASWMLADFASMPVAFTHRTNDAMRCPIPEGWAYRRYRIWPAEETAA